MRTLFATLLIALGLWGLGTPPARAWDAGAHMLVAEIAWRHLTPEARALAKDLPPLLDNRARRDGRPYHFVSAGPWMDDIKSFQKEYPWNRLHYVNLECDTPFPSHPPADPNAFSALQAASTTLRDTRATPKARAQALGQIIHLVADIHQPLHAASRHDRGGNGYLIAPPAPYPSQRRSTHPYSLHRFWDNAYRFDRSEDGQIEEIIDSRDISRRPRHPTDPQSDISRQATRLLRAYPKKTLTLLAPSQPEAFWEWIRESHEIARKSGWPPGPAPRSYEVGRIDATFVAQARPIAERQIVLAGYRLANLLNQISATQQ